MNFETLCVWAIGLIGFGAAVVIAYVDWREDYRRQPTVLDSAQIAAALRGKRGKE